VHHPVLGDFHDQFLVVAPWAGHVAAGSQLSVLVAPTERETWLTLGLERETSTPRPALERTLNRSG
jgi:hypothetical protein